MFFRGAALVFLLAAGLVASGAVQSKPDPTPDQVQHIIQTFTQNETNFAKARENYTWTQSIRLDEVDPPGGSYELVEDVGFDSLNHRNATITYAPVSTLQNIMMTEQDEEDFRDIMPFVMTNDTRDQYNVKYLGWQKVDEIGCYVFSVQPKVLTKDKKRYFDGQIWVDDQELQIVKTYGKGVGRLGRGEHQQFPMFETYRQQIDGKYWFPVYTYSDDTLHFEDGQSQKIKIVIRYKNYKRFNINSIIKYGSVQPDEPPKATDGQK